MAIDTPQSVRNLVIYEIYVRSHGHNGKFKDVTADLSRIRALGVDYIWFMPIHPIGEINKKGSQGCPYSIRDYRAVNPEYGSLEDFRDLISKAHALGLKVMIDVVYNHTSHDSILVHDHPEWFHQDEKGLPVTTVPDWTDVIDLKHPNPGLTRYLIDSLKYWVGIGVDGFRCDVASIVPLEFWLQARKEVAEVNPQTLWLAESVHSLFVEIRRQQGLIGLSDGELYQAFDICYDYDIIPAWMEAVEGKIPLDYYLDLLRFQRCIYPDNAVKLRYVENHDISRVMGFIPNRNIALAWTAFSAFNHGAWLLYAGQESAEDHQPSLFEAEKIRWGNYELSPFIQKLSSIKKDPILTKGHLHWVDADEVIQAAWWDGQNGMMGVFNVRGKKGSISIDLPDGLYRDILSDQDITIVSGQIEAPRTASIIRYKSVASPKSKPTTLFPIDLI